MILKLNQLRKRALQQACVKPPLNLFFFPAQSLKYFAKEIKQFKDSCLLNMTNSFGLVNNWLN